MRVARFLAVLLSLMAFLAGQTSAAPVDLSTWSQKGPAANGNWTVGGGGTFVTQSINGDPTFFVSPNSVINTQIQGSFSVETTSDDDYIGFVFGYQSPAGTGNDFNFILFDWKQTDQDVASEGFALTRVNQTTTDYIPCFWAHTDSAACDVLATDQGDTRGWADNTTYTFKLDYTEDNISITIGGGAFGTGEKIFDVDGSFAAGQFGFYNYSQASVRYEGFTEDELPPPSPSVPEPASLLLLGSGALVIAVRRLIPRRS